MSNICNALTIFAGTYDCAVNIWNRKSGERICSRIEHSEPVKAVAWFNVSQSKQIKLIAFDLC